MKERLLRILNIKASESKYVFDLLSIQLFIGIANSLLNIVAFTLFIHHFPASTIAYAYITISILLSVLNLGYEKLEKKLSPLHLLRWIIVGSSVVLAFFWTGFLTIDEGVMIFSLLVLSTLFYMITGYAYWGLVSLLFNVRESKRVFSIVGSGDVPAKLIGYAAAPLLIPVIGLQNLLLLSIGALVTGLLLVNKLILKKRWERISNRSHEAHHNHHHSAHKETIIEFFLKHRLIFVISLLSIISYNVFNLVDYTFLTQIKAKSQNLSTLATYIAIFFAAGRLITLFLKLVFTSRVIEGLGVIPCLLITPLTLAAFTTLFLFFHEGNSVLFIFGIMAILTEVLRSAMQEPVFFILFQPLNEHHRLKGHIIAKGYMLAPSLLIVGSSLVLINYFNLHLSINGTILILLANLALWVAVIFYIRRAYARALHNSITRGIYTGEMINIADQSTINILLEKIDKGSIAEKVYALRLLEKSNYNAIDALLEKELQSPGAEMRQYALLRLQKRETVRQASLAEMVEKETNETVKVHAINMLCSMDRHYLRSFSESLSTLEPAVRKNVIVHMLNQEEFDYLYRAGQEINNLVHSEEPRERELALDIIGELKNIKFTEAIAALINDEDTAVKRAAMAVACKLRSHDLLPSVLQRLRNPTEKFIALQGLFLYGDRLFTDIKKLPGEELETLKPDLIKTAAKIKGPMATSYLLECLREGGALKERLIHFLWAKTYQAESVESIHQFEALLADYLRNGLQKIAYHLSTPKMLDSELLQSSIGNEIWNDLTTSLKLCSMIYPKKEIARVIELAESREREKLFNAMEMLEMVLPKKTARQINVLFDYLLDPADSKQKGLQTTNEAFLNTIVKGEGYHFSHWTKAICLFITYKNNQPHLLKQLITTPEKGESVVLAETREYVTTGIQQSHHVNY